MVYADVVCANGMVSPPSSRSPVPGHQVEVVLPEDRGELDLGPSRARDVDPLVGGELDVDDTALERARR